MDFKVLGRIIIIILACAQPLCATANTTAAEGTLSPVSVHSVRSLRFQTPRCPGRVCQLVFKHIDDDDVYYYIELHELQSIAGLDAHP